MCTIAKEFIESLNENNRARVLAYGSSNTERYLDGLHWFDCFEVAIRDNCGRKHTCINTGLSGDTSRGLLERFENDAALFKPHLVFITIGGNDCNPEKNLSKDEFRDNLKELYRRFMEMNCKVVFQTYYAPDPDDCETTRFNAMSEYMQIVREVAAETNSMLIDHLSRWEKLRERRNDIYKQLMLNGFHTNNAGNRVLGVDIARAFGIELKNTECGNFSQALEYQKIMDELETTA